MALPIFLGPHTIVALTAAPGAPLGGAAPGAANLGFSVQVQQQTNWCWSAVSTSVALFYSTASSWTQCTVANAALPRIDCCTMGASDPAKCNVPWYLDSALRVTGNFRSIVARPLTLAEIQSEIGGGAPVGTRVGWFGGGGHFQAIVGWLVGNTGTVYIDVSDPIYLNSQIALTDFASGYQSGGTWTHSYYTQLMGVTIAMTAGGSDLRFAASVHDQETIGA